MHDLTAHAQIARDFARDGFFFPVEVMTEAEAIACRRAIEDLERAHEADDLVARCLKQNGHFVLPFLDGLVRSPAILEPVTAILGPDLLVWACNLFSKAAHTDDFISWHQDLHYWGLGSTEEVTAWVALSPATRLSGCMRFVPGSHRMADLEHVDTFAPHNMLSRGQIASVEIDESQAVDVVLRAGQMSLHHGRTLHASNPNRSDDRRLGMAIRYITPKNRQVAGERDFATLVQGQDRFGYYELVPPPTGTLVPDEVAIWETAFEAKREFLYRGVEASRLA